MQLDPPNLAIGNKERIRHLHTAHLPHPSAAAFPPTAAVAFSTISSYSATGSESSTIAPPAPTTVSVGVSTAVRITTLRSARPSTVRYPSAPEYTPRALDSSSSSSSIVRIFGAPVIEPGGKHARTASIADTPDRSRPRTVVTS